MAPWHLRGPTGGASVRQSRSTTDCSLDVTGSWYDNGLGIQPLLPADGEIWAGA